MWERDNDASIVQQSRELLYHKAMARRKNKDSVVGSIDERYKYSRVAGLKMRVQNRIESLWTKGFFTMETIDILRANGMKTMVHCCIHFEWCSYLFQMISALYSRTYTSTSS